MRSVHGLRLRISQKKLAQREHRGRWKIGVDGRLLNVVWSGRAKCILGAALNRLARVANCRDLEFQCIYINK